MNKKKLICLVLVLMLLVSFIPNQSHAQPTFEVMASDGIRIQAVNHSDYQYDIIGLSDDYYPAIFTLKIEGSSGQVNSSSLNGAYIEYSGSPNWYTVYLMDSEDVLTIKGIKIKTHLPKGGSASAEGIYAFLPAPGQFVNSNMTTGGWGTVYTANDGQINGTKAIKENVVTTGVSLGSFGGYIILDYSKDPIKNSDDNMYGADFIVFGNAFKGNSEPGMIQVSKDGKNWYDIAGSLHYEAGVHPNAECTYTNPAPYGEGLEGTQTFGTSIDHNSNITGVSYVHSVAGQGYVNYNGWHRQKFFPLHHNYIETKFQNILDKPSKHNVLEFANHTLNLDTGSQLNLKGTYMDLGALFSDGGFTKTDKYTFGYCDVHPNGSATNVPNKPYLADDNTTNGDPIDISWAVDNERKPVYLDSIKYIRIYNPVAKDNPPFGEISTEVCGVKRVNGGGDGTKQSPPYLSIFKNGILVDSIFLTDMDSLTYNISGLSSSDKVKVKIQGAPADVVYLNNEKIQLDTTHTIKPSKLYRIITQNGTNVPHISVFEIVGN